LPHRGSPQPPLGIIPVISGVLSDYQATSAELF
jgi:hypothetical protein